MTTQRDSGRYDQFTGTWSQGNVKIDFAWGNVPLQPNDERGVHPLDPVLDSHEIAYLGWNGFPEYVPNTTHTSAPASGSGGSGGSGGPAMTYVPQVVGYNLSQVNTAFGQAGLQYTTVPRTDGATIENNNLVAGQGMPSGTAVPVGTSITLQVYSFTIPALPANWRPWIFAGSGSTLLPSSYPYSSYNPDFIANPTNYVVVVSGVTDNYGTSLDGTYPITGVSQSGPFSNVTISGLTLPYGQATIASTDGWPGTISIQHV